MITKKLEFARNFLLHNRFAFSEEMWLEIVAEPYDYSVTIGGDLVSSACCKGVSFRVSRRGEVQAYNVDGQLIATIPEQENEFKMISVRWEKGIFKLCFGYVYMMDTYPHCDGESDRWISAWETQYMVTFHEDTAKLEAFHP